MTESVYLWHGVVVRVSGHRVAVTFLSNPEVDGQPVRVELVVVAPGGVERDVTLGIGGEFHAGPDVWRVAEVEYLGDFDYAVRLDHVGTEIQLSHDGV
jgi:hypothetical protein